MAGQAGAAIVMKAYSRVGTTWLGRAGAQTGHGRACSAPIRRVSLQPSPLQVRLPSGEGRLSSPDALLSRLGGPHSAERRPLSTTIMRL